MKKIILTIKIIANNFRELIKIVKSLFQKEKTINLNIIF